MITYNYIKCNSIKMTKMLWKQTFSNISAKIWNSLTVNINVNVTFIKFKESLKLYLLNNTLLINYTK